MKVLALDIGDKRTGVAVGDTDHKLALPHGVIESRDTSDLVNQVATLVDQEKVELLVVGEPKSLSGQASEQTNKTKLIANQLKEKLAIKVILFDERLTTGRANVPASLPKRRVDELAAMYLLQDYLEKFNLA